MLAMLFLIALTAAVAGEPSKPVYQVTVEKNAVVPMRDGVKLATDLYFPAQNGARATGRFPTLLNRTPYGKSRGARLAEALARYGFVMVAQDTRGRYGSEGRWQMLVDDPRDGYDAVEWVATQPWSDGKVGMWGGSYEGMTQHAAAEMRPPHLTAILPTYGGANCGIYGMRHHGAFELRFFNWIFMMGARENPAALADPGLRKVLSEATDNVKSYLLRMPLRPGTTPLSLAPDYEAWLVEALSRGANDEWWRRKGLNVVDHVADYSDIPVYHLTGWYDSWTSQVADLSYAALAKAKHNQRLIVGPWTHGGQATPTSEPRPCSTAPRSICAGMTTGSRASTTASIASRRCACLSWAGGHPNGPALPRAPRTVGCSTAATGAMRRNGRRRERGPPRISCTRTAACAPRHPPGPPQFPGSSIRRARCPLSAAAFLQLPV